MQTENQTSLQFLVDMTNALNLFYNCFYCLKNRRFVLSYITIYLILPLK